MAPAAAPVRPGLPPPVTLITLAHDKAATSNRAHSLKQPAWGTNPTPQLRVSEQSPTLPSLGFTPGTHHGAGVDARRYGSRGSQTPRRRSPSSPGLTRPRPPADEGSRRTSPDLTRVTETDHSAAEFWHFRSVPKPAPSPTCGRRRYQLPAPPGAVTASDSQSSQKAAVSCQRNGLPRPQPAGSASLTVARKLHFPQSQGMPCSPAWPDHALLPDEPVARRPRRAEVALTRRRK